jgi:hypothetical protein
VCKRKRFCVRNCGHETQLCHDDTNCQHHVRQLETVTQLELVVMVGTHSSTRAGSPGRWGELVAQLLQCLTHRLLPRQCEEEQEGSQRDGYGGEG